MLRAEVRKLRTTRTTRWLWTIALVVVVLGTYSTVSSADPAELTGHVRDQTFHLVGAVNLSLIALLVGVRSITDEFRYGTISWTMLTRPHRGAALVAKAAVAGFYGVLIGLTTQVIGLAVAVVAVNGRGGALDIDLGDAGAIVGLTISVGMLAAVGVAVGALIRNQVIAVAAALAWMLAVETLGSAVLGGIGRFLPGHAARSFGAAGELGLRPIVAFAVLIAYVLVLLAAASRDFDRRPVLRAG